MPLEVQKNVSLKNRNWWKVGGSAENFCEPKTVVELKEALLRAQRENWNLHILSGGSNILVKEGIISGLVISLHEMKGVSFSGEENGRFRVQALCGTSKAELARLFLQKKLSPAVFLTGLPGDLGGGIVMNAGLGDAICPREFCEIVDWIEVLRPTGEQVRISSEQIKWEYRHTAGWQPGIITEASLSWPMDPRPEVLKELREATQKRVKTQPLDLPSGGSTFQNPPGQKAARLIDESGLKGFRIGGAAVSTKHANFIVNDRSASADDILALIKKVRSEVLEKKGIHLQTEVILFGGWDLDCTIS